MRSIRRVCPALALALVAACAEGAPPTQPLSTTDAALFAKQAGGPAPRFVHRAPQTPPFKNEVVKLVAKAGVESQATLRFADGSPFAELTLSAESMRGATLGGAPLADGQEITVTLRRVDASRYLIDLQPSGLDFNPDAPAELVFFYENAAVAASARIGVWKQERQGDAWQGTEHRDDRGRRQMRARVDDFTVYAMAYI